MVFDIKMKGTSDGQVTSLKPLLAPLSIQSFTLLDGTHLGEECFLLRFELCRHERNARVFMSRTALIARTVSALRHVKETAKVDVMVDRQLCW